jgi:GT2 family glycosyltransferase
VIVVLVHWNQPERCARTIERFQHQGLPVRIVVVDNGSRPDELERLRTTVRDVPHDVELVELGRNAGFGPAANVGFRRWLDDEDAGDWVALAPHDALPEDGCLPKLLDAARARSRAGLVCADVGDGHVPIVDPYFGGLTVPGDDRPGWQSVDYPHGTLLVASRSCITDIGLFDERYFAYCEEADLGLRATRAGWEVGLVRGAMVTNPTMRSGSPAVDYLMHRNTLLLVREHSGRYHAAVRFGIAGCQLLRGVAQPSARPPLFSARGRALGMLDFVRGRFGPPPPKLFAEAGEPGASRLEATVPVSG